MDEHEVISIPEKAEDLIELVSGILESETSPKNRIEIIYAITGFWLHSNDYDEQAKKELH